MKTGWNNLTEKQKEVFFTFFLYVKWSKHLPGSVCLAGPELWRKRSQYKGDSTTFYCVKHCKTLFPKLPPSWSKGPTCPCNHYGKEAFTTLETELRKDGWIP